MSSKTISGPHAGMCPPLWGTLKYTHSHTHTYWENGGLTSRFSCIGHRQVPSPLPALLEAHVAGRHLGFPDAPSPQSDATFSSWAQGEKSGGIGGQATVLFAVLSLSSPLHCHQGRGISDSTEGLEVTYGNHNTGLSHTDLKGCGNCGFPPRSWEKAPTKLIFFTRDVPMGIFPSSTNSQFLSWLCSSQLVSVRPTHPPTHYSSNFLCMKFFLLSTTFN